MCVCKCARARARERVCVRVCVSVSMRARMNTCVRAAACTHVLTDMHTCRGFDACRVTPAVLVVLDVVQERGKLDDKHAPWNFRLELLRLRNGDGLPPHPVHVAPIVRRVARGNLALDPILARTHQLRLARIWEPVRGAPQGRGQDVGRAAWRREPR